MLVSGDAPRRELVGAPVVGICDLFVPAPRTNKNSGFRVVESIVIQRAKVIIDLTPSTIIRRLRVCRMHTMYPRHPKSSKIIIIDDGVALYALIHCPSLPLRSTSNVSRTGQCRPASLAFGFCSHIGQVKDMRV
jgi:hypothetical protein